MLSDDELAWIIEALGTYGAAIVVYQLAIAALYRPVVTYTTDSTEARDA